MKKIFLCLLFAVIVLSGCEKEKIKPSLDFEQTNFEISLYDEITLKPIITNCDSNDIEYIISKPNVLTYADGKFKAIRDGRVMIIATLKGYEDVKSYIIVNITYDATIYNIYYVLNGGTINITTPINYTLIDLPLILPPLTKANATFVGWYDNQDYLGEHITTIPIGSSKNYTLYAKWDE